LFFSLILLFAGFHGAGAETPGQPGTNSTATEGGPVSAETTTRQDPPSPAAQQEPKTDQAPPPEAKTVTSERPQPQADPCFTVRVAGETWLDQVHDYVDRKLCQPAVWFDDFFGEDRVLEDVRPTMFIRLRNSARWTEGQGVDLIGHYRLRYRLPQMEKLLKRAKFYIISESSADKFTTQPGQPVDPGVDPETGVRKPIIGIRVNFFRWLRSLVSIDTGIKVRVPLDPFVRMRYQYTKPFGEVYLVRFTAALLYRYVEHFTETSQLDFERKMTTFTLIRWSNYVTYAEGTAGITWNTGISLLTQLSPKNAISYDTSMWGVNRPAWTIDNYRVGIKFRRNFHRTWLFFELEPEVTWPKDASGRRNATYAFMATLEIQFGK
jgi:hypothetical protein